MTTAVVRMAAATGPEILANVLPAFLLVIGTPLGIWWWLRRSRSGPTARLRITDKAALGRNTWIAVAEVDGQRFLIGAGEHGVGLISQLETAPLTDASRADALDDAAHERRPLVDAITSTHAMDSTSAPRMGLIRRLQLMTLRTSARPPRSAGASIR